MDKSKGIYELKAVGKNADGSDKADAYAKIPADVVDGLIKAGITSLSFTVTNPAPGAADSTDKCMSFHLAADENGNLWSKETAIAYWAWKEFWDAGKKIGFTVNLNEYAGRELIIYSNHCNVYPLTIQIAEFVDYEDPNAFVVASTNGGVEYIEGKGWHVYAADGEAIITWISLRTLYSIIFPKAISSSRFRL